MPSSYVTAACARAGTSIGIDSASAKRRANACMATSTIGAGEDARHSQCGEFEASTAEPEACARLRAPMPNFDLFQPEGPPPSATPGSLNSAQRAAVEHSGRAILVIAGAG